MLEKILEQKYSVECCKCVFSLMSAETMGDAYDCVKMQCIFVFLVIPSYLFFGNYYILKSATARQHNGIPVYAPRRSEDKQPDLPFSDSVSKEKMGNSGSRLRFWRRHRKSPCPQSNGHSDNPRPQVPDTYAHDQVGSPFPNDGQGPHGSVSLPAIPFVELQKAVVIRNDVNIKKESLCVEPDEDNPGKFLVSFVLDASAAGR
ncbi:hypothetical protein Pfo_007214 [Paulownia fortunei]|nr:hypothetical protein Pfo_007214 [Paulownia fortunei]